MIVAIDKNANFSIEFSIKYKSTNIDIVEASDTNINVLSPAECLFIERSQPIIADKMIDIIILNAIASTLNVVA